jgi:EmrB/QacA subfamily drug resistance transporter
MQNQDIDYRFKWYILASVGMGIFLGTIDGSIVNIALPTMVDYFNTDFSTVQWVVLAYLLTVTTLMLSIGRLADIRGKKPIYTLGFIIFTVGSLFSGLSTSVYLLIASRVFQGIGATMVTSLGMAIITEAFPPQERGRALGISGALVSVGIVLGPTLGGFIIQHLSWHWIFFVNLPIGVIGTLMVIRFVPDFRPKGGQTFDLAGAITLFISLMALLIGLTIGQNQGFNNLTVFILLAVFAIFLLIFIQIELRVHNPMLDMQIFKNALLSINLVTGFITFFAMSGTLILMPFFLEGVLKYDPQQAGLLLSVLPLALGLVAPLSGALSDRVGSRPITAIGLAVLVGGYILVSTLSAQTNTLGYILCFFPVGLGTGIFQSPNNSAIMGTAPRERLGIVSGMLAITRTLGQTTGIAVLGALWAAQTYSHAGKIYSGGATQAPALDQILGLHDTFRLVVIIMAFGLLLAMWALVMEYNRRHKQPSEKK